MSATRGFVKIVDKYKGIFMKKFLIVRSINVISVISCLCLMSLMNSTFAYTGSEPMGLVGKDEWLYFRFEYVDANDDNTTTASVDLIRRFNKVLARNGVAMAFTMVPLKARIYSEHLPSNAPITAYMASNYDRLATVLRAGKVNVVDLNQPFLTSPKRNEETPFFFRLDTHWAPSGAILAAESVRDYIVKDSSMQAILGTIPSKKYALRWEKKKITPLDFHGLVEHLPEGSPSFKDEYMLPFLVIKETRETAGLLNNASNASITLMGSSYSAEHYRFPDALRYALQRDILAISVPATHGAWEGMESYLRDDSFQLNKPKLIIWEMPERDMRAPPNFKYREARYQSDNTEWLLRASALVQTNCTPSTVTAKIVIGGLVASPTEVVYAGRTSDKDYIELSFSKPLDKLDYLVAMVSTAGSKKLTLEAFGAGVESRWIDYVVPGDGAEHVIKLPLPSKNKGFTKLKIYPGRGNSFAFNGLRICRQPEDLLR
jgi:alginate O-acetyltransferase complex protein AlgJ